MMIVINLFKTLMLLALVGLAAAAPSLNSGDAINTHCQPGCQSFFNICLTRQDAQYCRNFVCEYYGSLCKSCPACESLSPTSSKFTTVVDTHNDGSVRVVKRTPESHNSKSKLSTSGVSPKGCWVICRRDGCHYECSQGSKFMLNDKKNGFLIHERDLGNGIDATVEVGSPDGGSAELFKRELQSDEIDSDVSNVKETEVKHCRWLCRPRCYYKCSAARSTTLDDVENDIVLLKSDLSLGTEDMTAVDTSNQDSADVLKREAQSDDINSDASTAEEAKRRKCLWVCGPLRCHYKCFVARSTTLDNNDDGIMLDDFNLDNGTVSIKMPGLDEAGDDKCIHWICVFHNCFRVPCKNKASSKQVDNTPAKGKDILMTLGECREVCKDNNVCLKICAPNTIEPSTDPSHEFVCWQVCKGSTCWPACDGSTNANNNVAKRKASLARRQICQEHCTGPMCWRVCYTPFGVSDETNTTRN